MLKANVVPREIKFISGNESFSENSAQDSWSSRQSIASNLTIHMIGSCAFLTVLGLTTNKSRHSLVQLSSFFFSSSSFSFAYYESNVWLTLGNSQLTCVIDTDIRTIFLPQKYFLFCSQLPPDPKLQMQSAYSIYSSRVGLSLSSQILFLMPNRVMKKGSSTRILQMGLT